jgi:hypothetical protein
METGQTKAHFSIPSLIAIGAAIASFFVGAFGGFILALIAIFFGIVGVMLAMLPSERGGVVSVFSLFAGGIGLIVAVIRAVEWVFGGRG